MGVRQPLRRAIVVLAGASLLVCVVWARLASVWQPGDAIRTGALSAVADFNQDGSPDWVRSDRTVVSVALSPLVTSAVTLDHVGPVVGLFAVDMDRDGDTDLLTLTLAGRLRIWRNDGRGHFSPDIVVPRGLFGGSLPAALELLHGADFDHPGEGLGYRYQPVAPMCAAAMALPVRAGAGRVGSRPFTPCNRGSRPSSPRAPPTRVAA
jgi:hypothetical protein